MIHTILINIRTCVMNKEADFCLFVRAPRDHTEKKLLDPGSQTPYFCNIKTP